MNILNLLTDQPDTVAAELALAIDDSAAKQSLNDVFLRSNPELAILRESRFWGDYLQKGDFSREATMDLQMNLGEHSPSTKELEQIAGKLQDTSTPILESRSQEHLGRYRSEILPKFQQYLFDKEVSRDTAFYMAVRLNTYLSFLWEIEKERPVVFDFTTISLMDCLDKMQGHRKHQDFVQMFSLLTAVYHFQDCLENWKALGLDKPEENRRNILSVWRMLIGALGKIHGDEDGLFCLISEKNLLIEI